MLTQNTDELRRLVAEHVAADQVMQGNYWDGQRGCFIGCLNHSANPAGAADRFGLPIAVQKIAESIFEGLQSEDAVAFFAALPDAVATDGKDLGKVVWQFLATVLRELPPQSADIKAAIDLVIAGMDLLADGREWPAAAWAAYAARVAAADAAAWAAAAAARAATAWAAADFAAATTAAAWAATDFAACRRRQRDLLLQLISEAPVVGQEVAA